MTIHRIELLRGFEQLSRRLSRTFGHLRPDRLDGVFGVGAEENDDGIQLRKMETIHGSRGHIQQAGKRNDSKAH